MTGWKILTHHFCSPLQGGSAIWDGTTLPFTLPKANLNTSSEECAEGWNFCDDLATAASIAGFWPTGRPAVGLLVEPAKDAIARGNKRRASTLTLVRRATLEEWEAAIKQLSTQWFGAKADEMAAEQLAWFIALGRPERDAAKIEAGLRLALDARGLSNWRLRRFDSARAAWAAWAARDAWAAWDARAARDAWAARAAWAAWDARDAWAAWDARAAWAAWAALSVSFAAQQGWISHRHDLLTVGIRDAYLNGLELAIPTGPDELGWAMAE